MDEKKHCQRCRKEINPESESVFANGEGKFWCDERCLGVRTPNLNRPQPHFE